MADVQDESSLLDGSRDLTVGAEGENGEPLDPKVRDLAALAYLVVTCQALGIETDDEWDRFMYARAIHRRVHAHLSTSPASECDNYAGGLTCIAVGCTTPCDRCRRPIPPAKATPC